MPGKRQPGKPERVSLFVRLTAEERKFFDRIRVRYPRKSRSYAMQDCLERFLYAMKHDERSVAFATMPLRRKDDLVIRGYTIDKPVLDELTRLCERRLWQQTFVVRTAVAHFARQLDKEDQKVKEEAAAARAARRAAVLGEDDN
ncbi:hypothetical protein [Marinivivus vitaminiproducens]|uniref:hypothetical protein n=1 Tax=Marinivivus vitaminiproducens TaxID=3035935 RepID=UPI00279A2A35|nr:hypothetical protein P4R82_25050 [Geminicoccaceae bacterium SCSIO 64248]